MKAKADQQYDQINEYHVCKIIIFPGSQPIKSKSLGAIAQLWLKQHKTKIAYATRWGALLCLLMLAILPRFEQPVATPDIVVFPEMLYTAENDLEVQFEMLGTTHSFLMETVHDVLPIYY